ncbi:sulfur carrier protein ThiS [Alkalihalobacterium alkalinitrilicum]|uniref:sulfur carrier protein ThiS n=1 Tax=Alkalihalobacterium alkalinitrilicum TaxID=427920 RepID=UPI000994B54B|nr:sulfur carrier protein ThiS [Alkalihalobacterium alkalinitrilicum]
MELYINGETVELEVKTLIDIVKHYGLEKDLVVTEVNGEIVDRSNWEDTMVEPGMKIELVHFVGGG